MKRSNIFWICLLLGIAALLAACGGGGEAGSGDEAAAPTEVSSESEADASSEGEAETSSESAAEESSAESGEPVVTRIGWAGSPDTLNPGTAVLAEAYTLFELVYDSMYQLELDGTYSLELADSVDVSDDGLVYTYHIRDGVYLPRRRTSHRRRRRLFL